MIQASLVQLIQAWHCARLVQEGEQRLRTRYATIVRIRSDVVVGGQLWETRLQPWESMAAHVLTPGGQRHPAKSTGSCLKVSQMRASLLEREESMAGRCLAQSGGGAWLVHAEWFAAGSGREMIVLLRAIDTLAAASMRRNLSRPLHAAGWELALEQVGLQQRASRCRHVRSTISACADAFCDFDFVRAFGPPMSAYYFQESEWLCSAPGWCPRTPPEACPSQCINPSCIAFMHSRWHIPLAQLHLGLDYKT